MDRLIFEHGLFFGLVNVTEDSDMKLIKPMCYIRYWRIYSFSSKVSEDGINVRERREGIMESLATSTDAIK